MLRGKSLEEFASIVGRENLLTSREELLCYGYDAQHVEGLPDAVVAPRSTEEVAKVLRLANRERIPVVPRGAGTGLSGGSVPARGGIVLLLRKMDKVLKIDKGELYAVVQAGVVNKDLNDMLAPLGLFYPPDPASYRTSTLGGNIATNAGGPHTLKYGVTRDYVLGLEVVSPTGEIYRTGALTVKSVSGYDMTSLLVGSGGTLGVITEATLRLLPRPEHTETMTASFPAIRKAAEAVTAILASGITPSTLELMDRTTVDVVEDFKHLGLPRSAEALLLIETDGPRKRAEEEAAAVAAICKGLGADVKSATSTEERERLWEGRRAALPALARLKPTTILEDVTVPRTRIPEMLEAVWRIARREGIRVGVFGHAGDGNLHPTFLVDERDGEEMERVERAVEEMFVVALGLGGTLSGEHGIGITKARFLELERGKEGVEVMRRIKRALDPNGILNPGKIFP